ncbi:hypothetical protein ACFVZ6_00925, partial [Streptomyces sp. NPDC059597]
LRTVAIPVLFAFTSVMVLAGQAHAEDIKPVGIGDLFWSYRPREDDIDAEVRADLDRWEQHDGIRFAGRDGPRRFPASRREALAALRRFTRHRLAGFGPHEDAMLAGDPVMSHSLLSSSLNLGLLDPAEAVDAAEDAWRSGHAPVHSAEGFVRQIAGWREYVWHLYWYFGEDYRHRNALRHHAPLPDWFADLDADAVTARCLATALAQVRDTGWTHHIPRLMLLGSHALQQGWDPAAVTDWFHRSFVDGYDWVMLPNVVGMSQYADGGRMTTKPYTSGGAYIHRMSDLCDGCAYRPGDRTGERACPFTTGYWSFVHRHRAVLAGNPRTARAVQGLDRLGDLDEVLRTQRGGGGGAPRLPAPAPPPLRRLLSFPGAGPGAVPPGPGAAPRVPAAARSCRSAATGTATAAARCTPPRCRRCRSC